MLREVVQKKFPLRHAPKSGHLVVVKANHERGNDIEFFTELWERTKRLDLLNDTADTEQALWTRHVEFKLADPPDVDSDPTIEIEIFRPVRAGICNGISPANLLKASRIECLDDPLCSQLEAFRAQ